jgi:putative ABC transport system permease protein
LISAFAAVAAFIAAIGIYGVLGYVVAQRTNEIGIRMALGAERRSVLRLVMAQGASIVVVGVLAGLAGAAWLTRYIAGMLFGVTALDVGTYLVAGAAFAIVALIAAYVPARRATAIDPVSALRYE